MPIFQHDHLGGRVQAIGDLLFEQSCQLVRCLRIDPGGLRIRGL